MPRARVNGVELYYEVQGQGPPVLFIHGGYGGPTSTLRRGPRPLAGVLTEGVRLITYDRRNCGQSQYVLDEFTLEDLAEDARALLDHLGVERSIVIGSSAGGIIALQYTLLWPGRVHALALANTGPGIMNPQPLGVREPLSGEVRDRISVVQERIALVERARSEGDRAAFESRRDEFRAPPEVDEAESPPQQRERAEALRAALLEASDEELFVYSTGALRNMAASIEHDFTPRLAELAMPVCIIHGNADTTVPFEYGQVIAAGVPHAEFHEIDGAGHGILAHEQARSIIGEWVSRVAAV